MKGNKTAKQTVENWRLATFYFENITSYSEWKVQIANVIFMTYIRLIVKGGDVVTNDSIEDWFRLYEKDLTSYLIYYTESMDVEDLVQDTFMIAMTKMPQFKGKSNPKTWLISIARNIVIDKYRRGKVWNKIRHLITREHEAINKIEGQLLANQENIQLYKAINKLAPRSKELVILRGILDLPSKEVSELLKTSVNNVNVMYHRSLKKLKELLEEEGVTHEGAENLQEELKNLPKYSLNENQKQQIIHALIKKQRSKKKTAVMKPLIAVGIIFLLAFMLILSNDNSKILDDLKLSFKPETELTAQEASIFKNQDYVVTGIEEKLGILFHENFVAKDHRRVAKLMLYFWGNPMELIGKNYRVEAINGKNENIMLSEGLLHPPLGDEDAHTLTSFATLPSEGEWQLSFFVNDKLFDEFIIDVLPSFPQTEHFLLSTSPMEMEIGEEVEVYIDSMLGEKKEIKVNLVNNKGKVISNHLFIQSSEAIDSSTGERIYTYSGEISIPNQGTWKLEIDGEETAAFEN